MIPNRLTLKSYERPCQKHNYSFLLDMPVSQFKRRVANVKKIISNFEMADQGKNPKLREFSYYNSSYSPVSSPCAGQPSTLK